MKKPTMQPSPENGHLLTFLQALIKNPRGIGAFCPSSPYLAREMVRNVQIKHNEQVLELGPGTGVITQALLASGCPAQQVIAVEYSPAFAEKLHTRFPNIKIIQGNAAELDRLINPEEQIAYVISSLPLRSLPLAISRTILDQIEKILCPGGYYIQFTYSYGHNIFGEFTTLKHMSSKRVWLNFPPARVDVWKKLNK